MLPFPINFITSDVEGTAAAEPAKIQIEFSESETISIEEVQVDPKSLTQSQKRWVSRVKRAFSDYPNPKSRHPPPLHKKPIKILESF